MVYAEPIRRPRIRFINPNSPLSTITMPELIRRMTFTRKAVFMPTGLAVCAAVMPRDWHVEIIDECAQDQPHVPRADVDLVGITAMTTQAKRAYELADVYRRLGVTVFLGGIHPSALAEEARLHADAVCKGDGETCLPHMLADWQRGDLQPVYDWTRYPTAPIATPRKDLLDPRAYLIFNPIQTTRGCPHDCTFCTTPGVFGRQFRQRRIADIVEEIREAKERFHSWVFIFADDDFAGNHKWALELCAALEPLRIRWASQCDILISNHDRLLAAMRRSGCLGLILGLESPNQAALSEAGKKYVRADTYAWRIRKIQSYGISLWGAFIFGFDTDDWRTCRDTCRFAQGSDLVMSCYPILTPYPGTGIWHEYEQSGRIVCRDWERFNGASVVYQPKRMTIAELRHAQMAAFAEFYSFRSAFRRLRFWPFKKHSWLANLAIERGIRHYYAKRGRRVPSFADFRHLDSPAWNYRETYAERSVPATDHPGVSDGAVSWERLAAKVVAAHDPYRHAARTVAVLNAHASGALAGDVS
ncbi:MAG: radical SAM protein [Planctomycetota bacterium]